MIRLYIDNIWTKMEIDLSVSPSIINDIRFSMSYKIQQYSRWKKEYTDLEYTLLEENDNGIRYPTGLYSMLHGILASHKLKYDVIDLRQRPLINPAHDFKFTSIKKLRDYQEEVVDIAVKSERGIIKLPTGAGKTTVAGAIVSRLSVKTLFIVNSIDLLEQAYDDFKEMISGVRIGRIGGGYCEIGDVNVCTIQTLHSALGLEYERMEEEYKEEIDPTVLKRKEEIIKAIKSSDLSICDETHHIQASSYVNAMQASNCYFRFGMSATPFKMESKDVVVNAYAGKQIANINASYLIDRGFLVPPTIYFLEPNNLPKYKFIYGQFSTAYNKWIVENKKRNECIVDCVERFVEMSKTMLITVSRIEHGETIMDLISKRLPKVKAAFIQGCVKKEDRKILLNKVRSKELQVICGTQLADEGLDLPALDAAIIAGGGKSLVKTIQRVGRTLRPFPNAENNIKKEAIIVDFYDHIRYLTGQSKRRMEIYRQEPRFKVVEYF